MKEYVKYVWQLSKGQRGALLMIMIIGIVNIGLGLLFIWICKEVIDIATSHGSRPIWPIVGCMGATMVIRLLLMGLRQYIVNRTNIILTNSIRQRLFTKVMHSPWRGREDMAAGDVMSRLGEDLRVVVSCLTSVVPNIAQSGCQLVAASWFLFVLQPVLLWGLLAITPIAILLSKIYYKTTRKLTEKIRSEEADITSHMQESLLNRPLLLSLQRVGLMTDRLDGKQDMLYDTYNKRIRFSVQARLFVHFTFMLGYASAFVWGAYGIMIGTVTYGMMTAFLQLVAQVQNPILNLSELLPQLVQCNTASDRLRGLAGATNPNEPEPESKASAVICKNPKDIIVKNLSFRYPDGKRDILKNLSLVIKSGSAVSIVGHTGSGKSTFVRLLLGLLKPSEGSIDLAGQSVAYVPQGNSLLRGTIRENLLLGKLDATDEELHEALSRAAALFVYDLPNGLDSMCGEKGSGLSEGQAQRIAIARALLQPGTIMILDEASSALDQETERQILEDIQKNQTGKTLIWVTHHEIVKEYMPEVIDI